MTELTTRLTAAAAVAQAIATELSALAVLSATYTEPPPPTYALSASALQVSEGDSGTISLTTTGVAQGTALGYTISGVTAGDLAGGTMSGTFVVGADGSAQVTIQILADLLTEGPEIMLVTLDGGQASTAVTVLDTSVTPTPPPPPPPPAPEPAPPPPAAVSKYRCQMPQLFQSIAQASIPPRLLGQAPRQLESFGPTADYIAFETGWKWAHKGGDWIDADGVPQGAKPWASMVIDSAPEGGSASYGVDVTAMLAEAMRRDMPFAFLLRCTAPRELSTLHGSEPPKAIVTMADGSSQALVPLFAGPANVGAPAQAKPTMALPAFFEFARPSGSVTKAELRFTAKTLARNSSPAGTLWLLSPDRALPAVRPDPTSPQLIGEHRYADDVAEDTYLFRDARPTWQQNIGASANWSPELFDANAAPDHTKYPYIGAGRWLNPSPDVSVVRGSDIAHGPIAPGLGALRVRIPPDPQAVEGGYAARAGLAVCQLEMPLPVDMIGRLQRLFTRFYFSWAPLAGAQDSISLAEVLAIYKGANNTAPAWTAIGGKFGIGPVHNTNAGGFSGSAGRGDGWQNRLSHTLPLTGMPGPSMGGLLAAEHMYDYQALKHPLHLVSAGSLVPDGWGKIGGVLYARKWYCIERELKLNSVDKPGVLADGSPHLINGVPQYWTADGEMRTWIDGMLAWESTGLVMRTLPATKAPVGADPRVTLYPIRDLGIRSLMLNTYIGGTEPSSKPFDTYYAGLAYGPEYIGQAV